MTANLSPALVVLLMMEKEYITPLENMPDETETLKNPVLFKIGFVFALLGILTPLFVYLAARLIIPKPCCGQDGTPGDGLGLMLIGICGIAWWTLMEIISFGLTMAGLARRETGRVKILAIASSALSFILIVLVYAAAIALVNYSSGT